LILLNSLRSVPKDHLLVRQMGLTKVAAVFACRRHERALLSCASVTMPGCSLVRGLLDD